jgi:hypothetical protein
MGDKAMTEALGRLQLNDNEAVLETLQRLRHVISRFLFFHEGTKAEYDRAMAERALISAMIVEYDLPLSANVSEWKAIANQEGLVGISNPAPLSAIHTLSQPAPAVPEEPTPNPMEEVD